MSTPRSGRRARKAAGAAPATPTIPYSLLVKPASADCNIHCDYCFYLEKASLYPSARIHRMSPQVLEAMIGAYMNTSQPVYAFGWQGGEPTLMGREFFERAVELQKRHARPGSTVSNGLQTNGILINDRFARFLAQNKFLIGISIDGPETVHDRYRKTEANGGTWRRVIAGMQRLQDAGVEFNVLVLVSQANVERAAEVYHHLCDLGIRHHQYIPCVEHDPQGQPAPFSITGEQWGRFMIELFDQWRERDTHRVSIRHFDSVLEFLLTGRHNVCAMGGSCNRYLVVEHNGDIYPCDFFVEPALRLGNITTDALDAVWRSGRFRAFGAAKARWPEKCATCRYLPLCSGDCLKHRPLRAATGVGTASHSTAQDDPPPSALCAGWLAFYDHALPTFRALAAEIAQRDRRFNPSRAVDGCGAPTLAPDQECYCGSGKRFKNCHGARVVAPAARESR